MNVQIIDFVAWQLNKNTGGNSAGVKQNLNLLAKQKLEIVLMSMFQLAQNISFEEFLQKQKYGEREYFSELLMGKQLPL